VAYPAYPVQLDVGYQHEYSRWLPLVKWLLAIPHYVVLAFLAIGFFFAYIGAFFAVLFTGKYPEGIFNFMVGFHRWVQRVNAYVLLLVDPYPPFSLEDDPSYPVRFTIDYPPGGEIARWRPLVSWLLAIPALIVSTLVIYAALIAEIVAFFTILFSQQISKGLFDFIVKAMRWQARANAYTEFMTEKYPPFQLG